MRDGDPFPEDPPPSWDDLSPSEQLDAKMAPITLGLLILLGYLLFRA